MPSAMETKGIGELGLEKPMVMLKEKGTPIKKNGKKNAEKKKTYAYGYHVRREKKKDEIWTTWCADKKTLYDKESACNGSDKFGINEKTLDGKIKPLELCKEGTSGEDHLSVGIPFKVSPVIFKGGKPCSKNKEKEPISLPIPTLSSENRRDSNQDFAPIQTKLKISTPNDKYEQEADRIADQVMRMEDESISIRGNTNSSLVQSKKKELELETNVNNLSGSLDSGGKPLDASVKKYFEPRFGMDLSGIKVHTDSVASKNSENIGAKAFTYGNNIHFGSGEYTPHSNDGKTLIAHEITHSIQQGLQGKSIQRTRDDRGSRRIPNKPEVKPKGCPEWEKEDQGERARLAADHYIVHVLKETPKENGYDCVSKGDCWARHENDYINVTMQPRTKPGELVVYMSGGKGKRCFYEYSCEYSSYPTFTIKKCV